MVNLRNGIVLSLMIIQNQAIKISQSNTEGLSLDKNDIDYEDKLDAIQELNQKKEIESQIKLDLESTIGDKKLT